MSSPIEVEVSQATWLPPQVRGYFSATVNLKLEIDGQKHLTGPIEMSGQVTEGKLELSIDASRRLSKAVSRITRNGNSVSNVRELVCISLKQAIGNLPSPV